MSDKKGGNTKVGKSGYFGVYWHDTANKWGVQIRLGKKLKYIGLYEDILDAAKAYDLVAREYGKKLLNFKGE